MTKRKTYIPSWLTGRSVLISVMIVVVASGFLFAISRQGRAQSARPDLIVVAGTLQADGDATFTIKNIGQVDIPDFIKLGFRFQWVGGQRVSMQEIIVRSGGYSLGVGQSVDLKMSTVLGARKDLFIAAGKTAGATSVLITVDPEDYLTENSESNNSAFPKKALSDLAITNLTLNDNELAFDIENRGQGAMPNNTNISYSLSFMTVNGTKTGSIGTYTYPPFKSGLMPGFKMHVSWPFVVKGPLPLDAVKARVTVSANIWPNRLVIQDADVSNNSGEAVRPLPDLTIEGVTLTDKDLSFDIKNIGKGSVSQTAILTYTYTFVNLRGAVVGTIGTNANAPLRINLAADQKSHVSVALSGRTAVPADAVKVAVTIRGQLLTANRPALPEANTRNNSAIIDRVVKAPASLDHIVLVLSRTNMEPNLAVQLKVMAYYSDDTTKDVANVAQYTVTGDFGEVSSSGMLLASATGGQGSVTASYTENGVTMTSTSPTISVFTFEEW